MSPGMESPVASMQALTALRVAMGPSSGAKVGRLDSQPGRPWPAWAAFHRDLSPSQAANRSSHSARKAWPRGMQRRYRSRTSSGTQKVSSGGRPRSSLVSRISSAGKGSPWALAVSVRWGDGIADVAAEDDQRGSVFLGLGPEQGRLDGPGVVGHLADVVHRPAVGGEALADVVGVGQLGGAVDGDVVVVVDVDQPAELEMAGQRGRLVGDALLEAAVTGDDVRVVVADFGREVGPQPSLGDAHAHAVGHPLAERTGGHLDARGVVELGVARGPAAPVTEAP